VDWIHLSQGREKWRAYLNTIFNLEIRGRQKHFKGILMCYFKRIDIQYIFETKNTHRILVVIS